jgi:prepilin-type processing-associated H-X9-DG protein
MSQLHPKYASAWRVFQSPFDARSSSEVDATAPISYGLNGNNKSGTSIVGLSADKIANAAAFILFAPAQEAGATVAFDPTATGSFAAPGILVYKNTSTPGGTPTGGTQNNRTRINALFADLHVESMLWSKFILDTDPNDPSAALRWDPYLGYP